MKRFTPFRQRLAWKLFLSYLVIIVVGVTVLAVTAVLNAPTALDRHMADMQSMMGGTAMMGDLRDNFVVAVNEVLAVAAAAAVIAAVIVSIFTARRIVGPVRAMTDASQQIANGDYHQRVHMPGEDELGVLAHSFNQMAETIEQTEQRRVELLGNVAHELRQPLSSIRSTMEGLVDGVLPAEPATFLSVQHEVTRLQRLVHDLEELSRAEAGQIPLELHSVDPGPLIRTAADRLQMQYEDKGVHLQEEIPPTLPTVRIDTARITQVLMNLLGNALQYTPANGFVTIKAWMEAQELLIAVHDTGVGISAEHLPHLFERFYRVDRSRSRAGGGSGIGLTISKYLVEAHGGRIWADSPGVGQGSTFTFTLPLA
ncbi:MAG: cell wall metabolism sensor histidine kinase WalK [Chloroflexi bacterium]|nr:cell wall metabolism sensor histidine kinase WalK [Chloroflexota bacterium]